MSEINSHICRVCGYNVGEPLWEDNYPNWIICDCCGSESGYDDSSNESVHSNRRKWIDGGYKWFNPQKKPASWNFRQQLNNIPEKWK
jgi:hypothetical protein